MFTSLICSYARTTLVLQRNLVYCRNIKYIVLQQTCAPPPYTHDHIAPTKVQSRKASNLTK